ncbi:MAG: rubrerythrin [Clostridium sp.]|uniref:rubrerythrin n=1 Tax=Clostridium sp. TaxID=1506 RepID=UPI003F2C66B9
MKSLKGTKTAENIMKAFVGECQARMRYTYFASIARNENYLQMAKIFLEIAENEKEHAKRFYKFLKEDFNGEKMHIDTDYPIEVPEDTKTNLIFAAEGEHDENTNLYPSFADIAQEEGFPEIAACFRMIAKAEVEHEKRFRTLADNIEKGIVFKREDPKTLWKCDNCGFIFEGSEPPKLCPACIHPQKHFEIFCQNY